MITDKLILSQTQVFEDIEIIQGHIVNIYELYPVILKLTCVFSDA